MAMRVSDNASKTGAPSEPAAEITRLSRRSVLRGAAGAGAGALAMTALAGPALAAARPAERHAATTTASQQASSEAGAEVADGEDVVVHVRDLASGEMDVYRGTRHVRVQDRDLAVRLARASK
jgi:hypothetical protein